MYYSGKIGFYLGGIMQRLFIFILCLSYSAVQLLGEDHLVNRYSPGVERFMGYLASSGSLQAYADRQRRTKPGMAESCAYSQLFEQAQRDVGIADDKMLPVRIISQGESSDKLGYVLTSRNEFEVVRERFDELPYGAKRIVGLHESFHHKYHDPVFEDWIFKRLNLTVIGTSALTTAACSRLIHRSMPAGKMKVATYLGAPIVSLIFNVVPFASLLGSVEFFKRPSKYDWFQEFRADRDAVTQARCYRCVQEYKTIAGPAQYLTQDELNVYIRHYEREGALCTEHRSLDDIDD